MFTRIMEAEYGDRRPPQHHYLLEEAEEIFAIIMNAQSERIEVLEMAEYNLRMKHRAANEDLESRIQWKREYVRVSQINDLANFHDTVSSSLKREATTPGEHLRMAIDRANNPQTNMVNLLMRHAQDLQYMEDTDVALKTQQLQNQKQIETALADECLYQRKVARRDAKQRIIETALAIRE